MKRFEEISQAAEKKYPFILDDRTIDVLERMGIDSVQLNCEITKEQSKFVQGALWADSHPRKGLVDINKVKIWIADFFDKCYIEDRAEGIEISDDFILKSFLKAMEE